MEQPRSAARSRTLTRTHARACAQADVKTAKLKKLWTRFQQAKQEVVDVQVGVVAVQHTHTRAHTLTHTHTHAHAHTHTPVRLQSEFQREREDMLDTIRELTRQLQLKQTVLSKFVPPDRLAALEKRAVWEEEEGEWVVEEKKGEENPVCVRACVRACARACVCGPATHARAPPHALARSCCPAAPSPPRPPVARSRSLPRRRPSSTRRPGSE